MGGKMRGKARRTNPHLIGNYYLSSANRVLRDVALKLHGPPHPRRPFTHHTSRVPATSNCTTLHHTAPPNRTNTAELRWEGTLIFFHIIINVASSTPNISFGPNPKIVVAGKLSRREPCTSARLCCRATRTRTRTSSLIATGDPSTRNPPVPAGSGGE